MNEQSENTEKDSNELRKKYSNAIAEFRKSGEANFMVFLDKYLKEDYETNSSND